MKIIILSLIITLSIVNIQGATYEKLMKKSKGSKRILPKPSKLSVGKHKLKAELLTTDTIKFLGDSTMRTLHSVLSIGKSVYVSDDFGNIYSFLCAKNKKLKLDKDFGDKGVMNFKSKVIRFIKLPKNQFVAVIDFGTDKLISEGKIIGDSPLYGEDYISLSGKWGIRPHTGCSSDNKYSRIELLTLKDGKYEAKEWITPEDNIPNYTMYNMSLGVIGGDKIYVGGCVKGDYEQLIVLTKDKKVLFRFGNSKSFQKDSFGCIVAIEQTPAGIIVLDSNFRNLKLISYDGQLLGVIDLEKLLGLNYPWIPAISYNQQDGYLYVLGAMSRKSNNNVADSFLFRISGFNKK